MDFGFDEINAQSDMVLIDASAVQAAPGQRSGNGHLHTMNEQSIYASRLISMMDEDKLFVSPGMAQEVMRFGRKVPDLNIPSNRYKMLLDYLCERLSSRVIVLAGEECRYATVASRILSFMDKEVSRNAKELIVYGMTVADFRARTAIITNDGELGNLFKRSMGFIREKEVCPSRRITVYGKFGNPKFIGLGYIERNGK